MRLPAYFQHKDCFHQKHVPEKLKPNKLSIEKFFVQWAGLLILIVWLEVQAWTTNTVVALGLCGDVVTGFPLQVH